MVKTKKDTILFKECCHTCLTWYCNFFCLWCGSSVWCVLLLYL